MSRTRLPRFAVFGQPVAHSRSPTIHAAFGAQCGMELEYERIEASPEDFARAVAAFARVGGTGANVTLPHKQAAFALCDSVSERACRAGAVNTLVRIARVSERTGGAAGLMLDSRASGERVADTAAPSSDGPVHWHGDNTDGIGLVRDLRDRHGLVLSGARVLLLGAGGAAAGVAPSLLDAGVAQLAIANRSLDRAVALLRHLDPGQADDRLHVQGWEALEWCEARLSSTPPDAREGWPDFDLVINATSASRGGARIPLPLDGGTRWVAVDLGYGEAAVPFLALARERGASRRIDGLGMLVEQAAESFRLWHGVTPATQPVYETLRAGIGDVP